MGSCLSSPNRRSRSRKFYSPSKKRCGKVSAVVPDEPSTWKTEENQFSSREIDHLESASRARRRVEVSNLTTHLTQLQWHHIREDKCADSLNFLVLSQEEERLDYATTLESDSDDDDNYNHGDLTNSLGTSTSPCESTLFPFDIPCKSEKIYCGSPASLAVENCSNINQDKTDILLSKEETTEGIQLLNLSDPKIVFQGVHEVNFNNHEQVSTWTNNPIDMYANFRRGTERTNHERTLKEYKPSCKLPSVFSINSSDDVQPNPIGVAQCYEHKLAVIQLPFRRKSKDDEASEISASGSYLCHPKTGIVLSITKESSSMELWYIFQPLSFKTYGRSYFRNKKNSTVLDHTPDTIGKDAILSHCQINHIAQRAESYSLPANVSVLALADKFGEGIHLVFDNEVCRDSIGIFFGNVTKSAEGFLIWSIICDWGSLRFLAEFNTQDLLSYEAEEKIVNKCKGNSSASQSMHKLYLEQKQKEQTEQVLFCIRKLRLLHSSAYS